MKLKLKRLISALIAGGLVAVSSCSAEKEPEKVQISIWSDEENIPLLTDMLDSFKEMNENEAVFDFTISVEGEDTCKTTLLANPQYAADIFFFADDQFEELYINDVLLEITLNPDDIIKSVGGKDSGAALAVTRNDKVYAYPETAGNGYFLYYNKDYFKSEDIITLDKILDVCEQNGKKFSMDFSSGWYIYSFFKGAGLELNSSEDGKTNYCNWNTTEGKYKGTDVAEAMLDVAKRSCFLSLTDDNFIEGIKDGSIIAGINGPWNAEKISAVWGESFAAAKLPTYTICGNQEQMCSFSGFKLTGINARTDYPEWCMKIADFLTNEENQLKRFESTGECPANLNAASTEKVLASPAVAALSAQSRYSNVQSVADSFWTPSSKLGITLAAGNPDGRELQQLLDETVAQITAPPVQQ